MRAFVLILAGLCGLAALGIGIAAAGTSSVPPEFALWALPLAAGALILAWLGRRVGRS